MKRDGPIFVIGCSRSGTTLLRDVVASHPAVASPLEESTFFGSFYGKYGDLQDDRDLRRLYMEFSQTKFFRRTGLNRQSFYHKLYTHPRNYGSFLDVIMSEFAKQQGAKRWLEKTPAHIFHIDEILEEFPTAQFIHIIRDVRDVVASRLKLKRDQRLKQGRQADIDKDSDVACIVDTTLYWLNCIHAGERKRRELGNEVLMAIHYEDLVRNTDETLEGLSEILELEPPLNPSMLETNLRERSALTRANTSFSPIKGLSDKPVGRYANYLIKEETQLVELLAGRTLRFCGYKPNRFMPIPGVLTDLAMFCWRNKRKALRCLQANIIGLYLRATAALGSQGCVKLALL